jgi:hypothetical protein
MTSLLPCVLAALVAAAGDAPSLRWQLVPPLPPDRNPPFTVSIYDTSMKPLQTGPLPADGVPKDVPDPKIEKAIVKVTDSANKLVGLAAISFDKGSRRWRPNPQQAIMAPAPKDGYEPVFLGAVPFQVQRSDGSTLPQPAAIEIYGVKDDGTRLDYGSKVASGRTGPLGEPYLEALDVESLEPAALRRLVVAREVDGNGAVLGSTSIQFDFDQGCWVAEGLKGLLQAAQPDIRIRIPARLPLQVGAIDQSGWLAGPADVAIYTLAGRCIRRGMSDASFLYCPEATEPLHPAYQRLLVAVRRTWGDGSPWGTMLITFDHNHWRPHRTYSQSGKARIEHIEFDDSHNRFFPIPNGNRWSAPPVLAPVTLPPIPLVYTAGGPCDSGQVPLPSPALFCSPAQGVLPPYSVASGLAPPWARLPLALPPAAGCPPLAAGLIASRDEAITQAGRPAAPDLPWADFGYCWVSGACGMYLQAPLRP